MHNLKKMANRIRWSWILKGTVLLLVVVNVVLGIKVTSTHLELKRLQAEEQNRLDEIFPPLSRNQVNSNLTQLFPGIVRFEHYVFGKTIKYHVFGEKELMGYAYQIREDIVCPACKDVRAFLGIDINGIISGIVLVNPFHFYGEALSEELVDEFLGQFLDKRLNNGFLLGTNVNGITGATKTVEQFLDGVLGITAVHQK